MKITDQSLHDINTKFARSGDMLPEEIFSFADKYFSSIDQNNGNEVFFVTRKSARWMLNKLDHDLLTKREVARVLYLKNQYTAEGNKSSWSDKPVVIDVENGEVVDGLKRLYAVALCNNPKAVSLPIEFLGE